MSVTPAPERVRALLRAGREDAIFSTAACEVGTASGAAFSDVVGTLTWDGAPAQLHTPFDVASLTKPIVGVLAMVLLEDGQISFEDPIGRFLPDFRKSDKTNLTVGELLTHTSGIPGKVPLYRSADTPERMRAAVRDLPLATAAGARVAYTSQGFMTLGWLLTAVAGQPLDAAVHSHVLTPAGMENTTFDLPDAQRHSAAATERCPWRDRVVQGTVHDENAHVLREPAGHAGIFSTAADMGMLCLAMLRGGAGRRQRILSEVGVATMTTGHTDHLNLRRCLAWQGRDPTGCPGGDLMSRASYGHTGFTGTSVWIDPHLGLYVVLLSNSVHPHRQPSRIGAFRRRFHNLVIGWARQDLDSVHP